MGQRTQREIHHDSDEASWTTPNSPVGSYVMNEDADSAERLVPEGAMHPQLAGLEPLSDTAAGLIGMLPDCRYLLQDFQRGSGWGASSLGARFIQREMLRSNTSKPSMSRSLWMRGAPQVGSTDLSAAQGFDHHICWHGSLLWVQYSWCVFNCGERHGLSSAFRMIFTAKK